MEYEKLFSTKRVVDNMKWISLLSICSSFIMVIICYFIYVQKIDESSKRVWLVEKLSGEVLKANHQQVNVDEQRIAEYKNHVMMFYNTMFTYDQFNYEKNIVKSSLLSGNCFKKIKGELDASYVKNKLLETNMRVYCDVDSIFIESKPNGEVLGISYAKQHFENSEGRTTRNLHARFTMIPQSLRTDQNPHAVLIENWVEFDTKVIDKKLFNAY